MFETDVNLKGDRKKDNLYPGAGYQFQPPFVGAIPQFYSYRGFGYQGYRGRSRPYRPSAPRPCHWCGSLSLVVRDCEEMKIAEEKSKK